MPTSYTHAPDSSEYAPYYGTYISKVPQGDIIDHLRKQVAETTALLDTLSVEQGNYCYAPGKWSLKEVIGHMCDTERIFAYRALRFSRNDTTPIPGFDQDLYIEAANFSERTLAELLVEFNVIRQATLHLFVPLTDAMMTCTGTASNALFSVRALAYIIVGHELHHLHIIRTRYLQ